MHQGNHQQAWDFDRVIDRRNSDSIKWGRYRGKDVVPMWVADMDFAVAPCIQQAIESRVKEGIFGYAAVPTSLVEATQDWLLRRWGWQVEASWLVAVPAVVPGLNFAVDSLNVDSLNSTASPVQLTWPTPIYGPIDQVASNLAIQGRPFSLLDNGQWDWDALDAQLKSGVNTLMLCCPQNPIGSIFDETALTQMAERIERYQLTVISDDIHGDLLLRPGLRHRPLAAVCPEIASRTITLISAAKTFNMPGLPFAFAVVPEPKLRRALKRRLKGQCPAGNVIAMAATEAAYRQGEIWLESLLDYLRGNLDLISQTVATLPGVHLIRPEATYLAWLDFTELGWDQPARKLETHGLGLSDGTEFNAPGFARLNFGCPRSVLLQGLDRLTQAVGG